MRPLTVLVLAAHVVSYDTRYSPLRYDPLAPETGHAALIVPSVQN